MIERLHSNDLLYGYTHGIFPMADSDTGEILWYSPEPRAIIPIDTYKPSSSLKPVLNKKTFEIRINQQFENVMRACAETPRADGSTWISEELIAVYTNLHHRGFAHSVECYVDNELAGGLYGVAIGAAFFGESMFYTVPNASKVAFHYLILMLQQGNFQLLDTQFINDNVRRYGAVEIPKRHYLHKLKDALKQQARFELLFQNGLTVEQ